MTTRTITINVDQKCPRCGRKGVPCLACTLKDLKAGKFEHILDKHRKKKPAGGE